MTNLIKIQDTEIRSIEYQGRRMVTFTMVDQLHRRPDGTARKRFNDHRARFAEGEDFVEIDQPSVLRTLGFERPQGGTAPSVTLLTESGYLMLVKPFSDDLAWRVQRDLVNVYFKAKDLVPAAVPAELAAKLDTLIAKVEAIEKRQEQPFLMLPMDFISNADARRIRATLRNLARLRTRDEPSRCASYRSALEVELRAQFGFTGAGSRWERFPRSKWPALQARLDGMAREIGRATHRPQLALVGGQ